MDRKVVPMREDVGRAGESSRRTNRAITASLKKTGTFRWTLYTPISYFCIDVRIVRKRGSVLITHTTRPALIRKRRYLVGKFCGINVLRDGGVAIE